MVVRNRRKSFHFDVLDVFIFITINPVIAEHRCGDLVPAMGPVFLCGPYGPISKRLEIGSVYFS